MEIVGIPTSVPDNKLKEPFTKLSTRLNLKLIVGILSPAIALAVMTVR